MNQRVYVTTVEGNPSFRVSERARDKFIDEEVERRHGKHPDGGAHEWQAFDETPSAQGEVAQEAQG
jgi:beta-galactosidase/beta-glucuronidase